MNHKMKVLIELKPTSKVFATVDTRFLPVKLWMMHMGLNENDSIFNKPIVEKALPTLKNIPILGFVAKSDDNGDKDFYGHEEIIVEMADGSQRLEYLGRAYGVIPESCNPQFENRLCDDGVMREFLTCDGLLWNKMVDSTDILLSKLSVPHSMELSPNIKGHYDANKKFVVESFEFEGACMLGSGVQPAMLNSTVEVDFATKFAKAISNRISQYQQLANPPQNNQLTADDLNKLSDSLGRIGALFSDATDANQKIYNALQQINTILGGK